MPWPERPLSGTGWDLRAAWATGAPIVLALERPASRRVAGLVVYVAPSDAFALLSEPGITEPVHVPLDLVLSTKRPHFHEPADVRLAGLRGPVRVVAPPDQLQLFDCA